MLITETLEFLHTAELKSIYLKQFQNIFCIVFSNLHWLFRTALTLISLSLLALPTALRRLEPYFSKHQTCVVALAVALEPQLFLAPAVTLAAQEF